MLRSDPTDTATGAAIGPAAAADRLRVTRAALVRVGGKGDTRGAVAANDNLVAPAAPPAAIAPQPSSLPPPAPASGALMRAALEHFACAGLGSAEAAISNAERAAIAGNHAARDHWLALAALFDRRRAAAIRERLTSRTL